MDEILEGAKERAWREVAALEHAHASGRIDDEGWHRGMAASIVPAYLAAATVEGGSGHSGTRKDWEWSRSLVADAIDRDGAFLDVGCANGLLMECVGPWGAARGHVVAPFGIDIAPELADLARRRVPRRSSGIFVGNALGWRPPRRFDFVRTGLEYVPAARRRELVAWLLDEVVVPGGRLIIGKFNEEIHRHAVEDDLRRWGFVVAGRSERAHRIEPRLAYRVVWIDAPPAAIGDLSFRSMRRDDLPQLVHWLAAPHIVEWWHAPLDLAAVHAKYGPRIAGSEPTHLYVIELRQRPIGWIQWYRWRDHAQHAGHLGADSGSAGVDLAIGEAGLLGQGIGSRVLRAFVERVVFAHPDVTACVADPEIRNVRSVEAFRKAGFTVAHVVQVPGEQTARQVVRRERP